MTRTIPVLAALTLAACSPQSPQGIRGNYLERVVKAADGTCVKQYGKDGIWSTNFEPEGRTCDQMIAEVRSNNSPLTKVIYP